MSDNSSDELFMDTLSDCSEDIDLLISDCEVDDNNSTIVPIYQSNRRILLSESEDDSADDSEANIIVNGVDDWTVDDIRVELEAYGRTACINTMPEHHESEWATVQLFLGDDLFELLATETNRYRAQVASKYKEYKAVKWVDVTVKEMKKFLGLIILMGQVRKDDIHYRSKVSGHLRNVE
ncbi:hypothetical protein ANTPLA_LOCUS10506 [Anthophora plagiata]